MLMVIGKAFINMLSNFKNVSSRIVFPFLLYTIHQCFCLISPPLRDILFSVFVLAQDRSTMHDKGIRGICCRSDSVTLELDLATVSAFTYLHVNIYLGNRYPWTEYLVLTLKPIIEIMI